MSTELATTERSATLAFEPSDFRGAYQMAEMLVKSRLLPKGADTPEKAFTIIVTGRELGLTAMQSLRSIHVIDGKPSLSADLMMALVKRSPECLFFRLVKSTAQMAEFQTHRKGEPTPTTLSFTIAEAQQAGIASKPVWRQYPAAMLRARCIAALSRAVYPDLMMGIYETDELEREETPRALQAAVVVSELLPEVTDMATGAVRHDADGVVAEQEQVPPGGYGGGPAEPPPEDEPAWMGEDSATQEAAEKLRSVDRAKREDSLCAQLEDRIKRSESRRAVERQYREAKALNLTPERTERIERFCAARCREIEATQPLGKPAGEVVDELGGRM